MLKDFGRRLVLVLSILAITGIQPLAPLARAQGVEGMQLSPKDFTLAAPRGFGDRNNSWAQAMTWWNGNLYVGTSRQSMCTSFFGIYEYLIKPIFGQELADQYFPYPPLDPDLSCAPDGADLPLQAEIWRWTAGSNSWQRVFQSPLEIDNPGPGAPAPPRTGKKLPYEISIRGFEAYTESDGTEALYAFGINSGILWDQTVLPPPRILRTTDGLTWTPVPQAPGTFLGDLPFNSDHSSFRSPQTYRGKMFVLSGPVFGQGSLIASADPAQGNDAWFLAEPAQMLFYELEVFNDWLYLGGFDPTQGYAIFKTRAEGTPPYPLELVVPPGAGLTDHPSKSVVSMFVHEGRLHVGTATLTEMIRLNPDDTWDLVIGAPRFVSSLNEWKYPISNLDAGFGHTLNDHAWYMSDPYRHLYVGTFNASTASRFDPEFGSLLEHNMGGHVYRTPDSWYFSPVTTNGFAEQSDAQGGRFDYGIRTMVSTPHGAFIGTANDYYGLAIFRGTKRTVPQVLPPTRVESESLKTGGTLLSWLPAKKAVAYRIFRAERIKILMRDDFSTYGFNGNFFGKIPDTYITPYQQIARTTDLFFTDTTVQPEKQYIYYVISEAKDGELSEPSNLLSFPLLYPSVTFAQLLNEVDRLEQRQRFLDPDNGASELRQKLQSARDLAAACQISQAIAGIKPKSYSNAVLSPDSVDVEVLLGRIVRRLELYSQFPQEVDTSEFCTASVN